MEQFIENLLKNTTLTNSLENFCNRTGLQNAIRANTLPNTNPAEDFWYRSSSIHVFESLIFVPLTILLYFFGARPYLRQIYASLPVSPKPPKFFDQVIGNIFVLCLVANLIFKSMRPHWEVQILWLLMSCHVITAIWSYIFLSRATSFNYVTCRILATLMTLSGWASILALATPDTSDYSKENNFFASLEYSVFYIQHVLLFIAPFYWQFAHGNNANTYVNLMSGSILPLKFGTILTYLTLMFTFNYLVYSPIAYTSGLNLMYALKPPKKILQIAKSFGEREGSGNLFMKNLLESKFYRFIVPVVLVVFGVLCYYAVTICSAGFERFVKVKNEVAKAKTTTTQQHQTTKRSSLNLQKKKVNNNENEQLLKSTEFFSSKTS